MTEGLCIHYIKSEKRCSTDGIGCKMRQNGDSCRKNGIVSETADNFRLEPVDKFSPF